MPVTFSPFPDVIPFSPAEILVKSLQKCVVNARKVLEKRNANENVGNMRVSGHHEDQLIATDLQCDAGFNAKLRRFNG